MPPRRNNSSRRSANKKRGRPAPAALEGTVLPLELGQEGVGVQVGRRQLTLPAGVPGERVRLLPPRSPREPAALERVLEPSPERVAAPCPLLQSCGGCTLQEMSYPAQLTAKGQALARALATLGFHDAPEVLGLSPPLGQRTKLLMASGGKAGELRLGFYRRGSMELVPAEGCPVQHPRSLALLASTRQLLDAHRVAPTRQGKGGWLHAVGLRIDPSGESELTLSASGRRIPRGLAEQLFALPSVAGVHLSVNPVRTSYPMEAGFRTLAGRPRTAFGLAGERVLLSPESFLQTSSAGAERLLELVRRLLPSRVGLLADLYAGAGLLTLGTRGQWRRAVTLEANPAAVADLRGFVEHEGSRGITVLEGRVERRVGEVLERGPDAVLLDPPRRGCAPPVIEALLARRPPLLLYVACGFEALMTQAELLVQGGYSVTGAGAVDMFPHTAHLETVVRLETP